jgi:IS5 family transposase
VAERFERFLPLVARTIDQAARRVLGGEAVPAKENVVSPFEPHAQVIVCRKARRPAEFGRKLWLDEVEGGLVGRYARLPVGGGGATAGAAGACSRT